MRKLLSFLLAFVGLIGLGSVVRVNAATVSQYELVTDVASLQNGDKIIIVNSDVTKGLSATLKSNNRGEVDITANAEKTVISSYSGIEEFELGIVEKESIKYYTLLAEEGYMYAASKSSNYLKFHESLDTENDYWKITLNEGICSMNAPLSSNRSTVRYNSSSKLFSCYESDTTQKDIKIYKLRTIEVSNIVNINFYLNDGTDSLISSLDLEQDSTFVYPSTPSRIGYTFVGWFDSAEGGNEVTTTVASRNMNIYAKWEEKELTSITDALTYESNTEVIVQGTVLQICKAGFILGETGSNDLIYVNKNGVSYELTVGQTVKVYGLIGKENKGKLIKLSSYELISIASKSVSSRGINGAYIGYVLSQVEENANVILPTEYVKFVGVVNVEPVNETERCYIKVGEVNVNIEYYSTSAMVSAAKALAGEKVAVEGYALGARSTAGVLEYCVSISAITDLPQYIFTAESTMASLSIDYNNDLTATNVDLRFGGVICNEAYNANAEYGVIVLASSDAASLNGLSLEGLNSLKNQHKALSATPVAVAGGYQFAWVINNMEGHYDYEFVAVMYMVVDGNVFLAQTKTASVNSVVDEYVTNASSLGISGDILTVLNKLNA